MKKIFIATMVAAAFITIYSSCKKDSVTANPETGPSASITIASPTANQTYRLGDTLHIVATIGGDVQMHGYDVVIVNTVSGDTVYQVGEHAHDMKLDIDKKWCCSLASAADLWLYIY